EPGLCLRQRTPYLHAARARLPDRRCACELGALPALCGSGRLRTEELVERGRMGLAKRTGTTRPALPAAQRIRELGASTMGTMAAAGPGRGRLPSERL